MKIINKFSSLIVSDYIFYLNYCKLDGPFNLSVKRISLVRFALSLFLAAPVRFAFLLRFFQLFKSVPLINSILQSFFNFIYSSDISLKAKFGPFLYFPHPFGIVIGSRVTLSGMNVIFHNTTLGKLRPGEIGGMPRIGRKVIISSGSCVLGEIDIGSSSVIACNSVVTKKVRPNVTISKVNKVLDGKYF